VTVAADWNAPERTVMAALGGEGDDADAVVTVVAVEGSAYRRPGAKLLLCADGADDVVGRLVARAEESGAFLERWNLTDGEGWSLGVRSSGVVDVLVEPFDGAYRRAARRYLSRASTTVCTVVESGRPDLAVGDRTLLAGGGAGAGEDWPPEVVEALVDAAAGLPAGDADTATVSTAPGDVRVLVDHLTPAPRLLVFGAAGDVRPVVELGERAGFEVDAVGVGDVDAPGAFDRVAPGASTARVDAGADTYALVMTHDVETDGRLLAALLSTEAPYVGVLGPPKRFDAVRDAMAAAGDPLAEADRERVFAPAGLDVGGEGPQATALSLVAEVAAAANGRRGGHLDGRDRPIHRRS
jgi:xanthine dehydrogenase accessory factor